MKTVKIYVRGICRNTGKYKEIKKGEYLAILEYKTKTKIIKGENINVTTNQMIIQGAIESIKLLKEPCNVELYVTTNIGIKKFKKSVNRELLICLMELIEKNGHSLKEIVSNKRQLQLKELMKNKL
ncbi:hypothetical protein ACV3OB_16065 [Clostridium perfringens]|uniref:hypothetical protein n=1 Tax=Clostridium perfringens TaxID=1502 RepID=UPI000D8BA247|nr:hypothetical protein [Clostridium perfringens]PWX25723.1 hypothetical protein CYK95_12610 [Clostridium perfringens]PWX58448.1 hypothetical protein CYK85_15325 [Clostridium perfringens]